jgi:hypothetical protein
MRHEIQGSLGGAHGRHDGSRLLQDLGDESAQVSRIVDDEHARCREP